MKYLFDTNALCEPTRKRPDEEFLRWFSELDGEPPYTTTISLAEVWQGWFRLPAKHPRRRELRFWAERLPDAFRLLKFDAAAAQAWGELTASGDPLPVRDSIIAAIALSRSLTVVTQDTGPFERAGCKVLSPWSGA